MRDTFPGGPLSLGQNQSSAERSEDYSQDPMGLKRKHSFTGTSSTNTTTAGPYGSTA